MPDQPAEPTPTPPAPPRTPESYAAILEQVKGLPFGPHGQQSVAYLMRSRNISLADAVLAMEQIVAESGDTYTNARRKNATGVRTKD